MLFTEYETNSLPGLKSAFSGIVTMLVPGDDDDIEDGEGDWSDIDDEDFEDMVEDEDDLHQIELDNDVFDPDDDDHMPDAEDDL
jgi:hypothetical protein